MARMPGAVWRPVVNRTKGGNKERRGLVLHVQVGNNSPFGWFNQGNSKASSDFWVSKSGVIEQYVDTGVDYAWAQAAGNPYYASVETEGYPGEPLTPKQIEGVAQIYAWGAATFGWPFVVVDSTTARGFTWHGAGGKAWGNHPSCPGDLRKAQRQAILNRAKQISSGGGQAPAPSGTTYTVKAGDTLTAIAKKYGTTVNELVKLNGLKDPDRLAVGQILKLPGAKAAPKPAPAPPFPGRQFFVLGAVNDHALKLQQWLDKGGWGPKYKVGPSRTMTQLDLDKVAALQRHYLKDLGPADGLTGPLTWRYAFEVAAGLRKK